MQDVYIKSVKCRMLMRSMGLSPKLSGYKYLVELMQLGFTLGIDNLFPLYKKGYVLLSGQLHKSVANIDKSIQNVICAACGNTNSVEFYRVFGSTIDEGKGKPTNKHFISTIYSVINKD